LLYGKHLLDEGRSEGKGEEMNEDGPCETNSRIWAKAKKAWTIPEDLLKEMVDLETMIVLIMGREGKSKFQKSSARILLKLECALSRIERC